MDTKKKTAKAKRKTAKPKRPVPEDKREAARRVIDAVRRDVRTRKALTENGLVWDEFNRLMQSDAELRREWNDARTTIEELWKIEKREQLHDAAMGRVPQQVTTPRGEVVTIYQPSIPALIRGIDQDTPKPKPVERDENAEALSAFQAALKLQSEVAAKEKAGK